MEGDIGEEHAVWKLGLETARAPHPVNATWLGLGLVRGRGRVRVRVRGLGVGLG